MRTIGRSMMPSMDRGISAIMATVIMVAIAVALAIGASIWSTSMASYYSPYEGLEVAQAWSYVMPQGDFMVNARIKNVGMTEMTVDNLLINGKPFPRFDGGVQVTIDEGGGAKPFDPDDPSTLPTLSQMEQALVAVQIPGGAVSNGQTLEFQIHTANGKAWHFYATLP